MRALLIIALIFSYSCSHVRTSGWDQNQKKVNISKMEQASLFKKILKDWDNRHKKAPLENMLANLERLTLSLGDDQTFEGKTKQDYFEWLSRGYYLLADAHYEDMEKKKSYWEVGTSWGERALAVNPEFAKKVSSKKVDWEDALKHLTKKDISAIYWTLSNLGKWAKNSGIATTLKYKSRIRSMNERVKELDERFFHGAAHRYLGSYYAIAPSFAGGDMNKSFVHFKKAMSLGPKYLGTKNLYAQFYLIKKGQRQKFIETLSSVLATPLNRKSDIYPENFIEQKKAKKMLTRVDELFD